MAKKSQPEPKPIPPAPAGLSAKTRMLWDSACRRGKAKTALRREMLYQTLAALDRADQAKAVLDAEGLTSTTAATGAVHLHPATRLEREFRAQAAKGFASLGLLSVTTDTYPFADLADNDDWSAARIDPRDSRCPVFVP